MSPDDLAALSAAIPGPLPPHGLTAILRAVAGLSRVCPDCGGKTYIRTSWESSGTRYERHRCRSCPWRCLRKSVNVHSCRSVQSTHQGK